MTAMTEPEVTNSYHHAGATSSSSVSLVAIPVTQVNVKVKNI